MGLTNSSTGSNLLNKDLQKLQKECDYTIAIAGNPNVGKSTIFNALTGMHQHTGNWPGKTVSNASGVFNYENNKFLLVDIPGTYSLRYNSEEEEIARNFIYSGNANLILVVVDATCLERNLNLVFQILEITNNVVLCVNLLDEAKKKGILIDMNLLSAELGIPVVGTIARNPKTLNNLKRTILKYCKNNETIVTNDRYSDYNKMEVYEIVQKCADVAKKVVTYTNNNKHLWHSKFDKILTSKIWGIPIMLCFLALIFWITISGANYPSKLLSSFFNFLYDKLFLLFSYLNFPEWIIGALLDGIYSTLTNVISVMLPPMAIFFPIFTLLEDSGFLPRIAFNMDRCFKHACSSGKQALTMCMGFGCNAAGVVGSRIIDSPREKLVSIITNNFVPCNGRFPFLITISMVFIGGIYSGIKASLISTLSVMFIVLIGIFITLIVSKILSKTLLKGFPSSFILELPPYRKPQFGKVLVRSIFDRTLFVLGRSIVIAAPAGLVIWLLATIESNGISLLTIIANFFDPFAKLMGLDGYILTGFILGLPANEIVLPIILMGYMNSNSLIHLDNNFAIGSILTNNGWNILTGINVMLFTLMHFPCSTTLMTIKKETGSWKWTFASFVIPTACGILICMTTTFIFNLLV